MNRIACFVVFFVWVNYSHAQIIDSFSDGEFTSSPVWTGDVGDWIISTNSTSATNVSGSNTLRLNGGTGSSGTKYLSTQRISSWGTEQSWGFWMGRRSGSTASLSNQGIVWLYASEANFTSPTVDGYRIVFGKSGEDNIILQVVSNGTETNLITSTGTVSNTIDDFAFLVRVTRTTSGIWSLYTSALPLVSGGGAIATDIPSSANANVLQGSVTDNSYTDFSNGYMGVQASYTSSYIDAAEFDQFYFDVSASSALPVQLSFFKAYYSNNKIILNWRTETELNNYGFEIERDDGRWKKIGFMKGNGNSNSPKEYSYAENVSTSGKFLYRLKQIDLNGNFKYSEITEITVPAPFGFTLNQNYPNPFNPATTISFSLPKQQHVTLEVFNILGQKIVTLLNEIRPAGIHSVNFDASSAGGGLNSGFYVYKLTAENFVQVKKMTLIK